MAQCVPLTQEDVSYPIILPKEMPIGEDVPKFVGGVLI